MKTIVSILILASLYACGTGEVAEPQSEPAPPSLPPPQWDPPSTATDVIPPAGHDGGYARYPSPERDAGSDANLGDSSQPSDAGPSNCGPKIGHCLTHMATWCYETAYDDTAACDKSGLSSGWHEGSCELGARSSGGCQRGCDVSYYYPLGGGDATEASRDYIKGFCEETGGTYIDTRPSEDPSDAGEE